MICNLLCKLRQLPIIVIFNYIVTADARSIDKQRRKEVVREVRNEKKKLTRREMISCGKQRSQTEEEEEEKERTPLADKILSGRKC